MLQIKVGNTEHYTYICTVMRIILDNSDKSFEERVDTQREARMQALHKQINKHKVDIDRSVFRKTKKEKEELKKRRVNYKNRQYEQ